MQLHLTPMRAAAGCVLGFLLVQNSLRAVFINDLSTRGLLDVPALWATVGAGLVNDLLALALLAIALLVCIALLPRSRSGERVIGVLLAVGAVATLLIGVGDALFWFAFGSRSNGVVCCATGWPPIVEAIVADRVDRYVSLGVAVASMALMYLALTGVAAALLRLPRRICIAVIAALLLLYGASMGPGPELWVQQAAHSAPVNVAANNGVLALAHSASVRSDRWSGVFPPRNPAAEAVLLGVAFSRAITDFDDVPRHLAFIGFDSGDQSVDERFDSLRGSGVFLDRLYATGFGSMRTFEAVFHGMPPLPGQPHNQRAGFERLPSLPRALAAAGFEATFIRAAPTRDVPPAYFSGIGFATVLEADQFPGGASMTSSGAADDPPYEALLHVMDERAETGARLFLATVARGGDALARFFSVARQSPWFDDTLFVVTQVARAQPDGAPYIPVARLRVPTVLIWRDRIQSELMPNIASTMDLPRTLLSQLDVVTDEALFGRDLFGISGSDAIDVAPVEYDYRLGIVSAAGLTVLMRGETPLAWQLQPDRPVAADDMQIRLAVAVFGTAADAVADR